ncbi:AMP-binding enzyme, partial [Necator americanus]
AMLVVQDLARKGHSLDLQSFFSLRTAEKIAEMLQQRSGHSKKAKNRTDQPLTIETHEIPLSSQQRRLWFLAQMYPERDSYIIRIRIDMEGEMKLDRLREAFQMVLMANPMARSVVPNASQDPSFIVMSGTECFHALTQEEVADPQIDGNSLIVTRLWKKNCNDCEFDLRIHHIISDGRSLAIVGEDLAKAYNGEKLPMKDVIFENPEHFDSMEFWRDYLVGYNLCPVGSEGDSRVVEAEAGYVDVDLSFVDELKIDKFCSIHKCTMYHIIVMAYVHTMRMTYDIDDFVVGTAVANRTPENIDIVGLFVNTIPLRFKEEFTDFHRQLRYTVSQILAAMDHQSTPLAKIIEETDCRPLLLVTDMNLDPMEVPILPPKIDRIVRYSFLNLCRSTYESLAYLIYTSGTTGAPKGVCISHQSVLNMLEHATRNYHFRPGIRVLQFTKSSFDASISNTFGALLNGGFLSIRDEEADVVEDLSSRLPIAVLHMTPIVMDIFDDHDLERLEDVEKWSFGGETISERTLHRMLGRGNRLIQLYGPTEATCYQTLLDMKVGHESICLGPIISNVSYGLCSFKNHQIHRHKFGQLFCGGENIARGYIGRNEAGFVANPLQTLKDKALARNSRIYLVGDEVKCDRAGYLYFFGRKDDQLKIKGYRVQLSEIDAAAKSQNVVENAVSVIQKDMTEANHIVLYYTGQEAQSSELEKSLAQNLPRYMIPSMIIHLEKFPVTSSGKVDKAELTKRCDINSCLNRPAEPRNNIEEVVLKCYRNVLKNEDLTVSSDFFQSGGHSLLAVKLVNDLQKSLNVVVPLMQVFVFPRVKDLAEYLVSTKGIQTRESKERLHPDDRPTPSQTTLLRSYRNKQIRMLYDIRLTVTLRKDIDRSILRNVLSSLPMIHPSLRTRFTKNGRTFAGEVWSGTECYQNLSEEIGHGLDPFLKPPFAVSFKENQLMMIINHIITDGHSMQLIVDSMMRLLNEKQLRMDNGLLFHSWLLQQFDKHRTEDVKFWQEELQNFVFNQLPTTRPRLITSTNEAGFFDIHVPNLWPTVNSWIIQHSCTPFASLLALFSRVLQSLSYEPALPVAIGFPVNLRTQQYFNSIGYGIGTVMVAEDTRGTLAEVIRKVAMHKFPKKIQPSFVHQALLYVIQKHESLRTVFYEIEGELKQMVLSMTDAYIHLTVEHSQDLRKSVAQVWTQPLELHNKTLVEAVLYDTADSFVALLRMHHIISDAWSTKILEEDLGEIIGKLESGILPAVHRQKHTYREYCEKKELPACVDDKYIENLIRAQDLPLFPSEAKVNVVSFEFPQENAHYWAAHRGISIFVGFLDILARSFVEHYGLSSINIGCPYANRTTKTRNVLGCFLNNIVFYIDKTKDGENSYQTLQIHVYFNCRYDLEYNVEDSGELLDLLPMRSEFPIEVDLDKRSDDYRVTFRIQESALNSAWKEFVDSFRARIVEETSPQTQRLTLAQLNRPVSRILETVLRAAQKTLGTSVVNQSDNFFTAGGNSLQAIAFVEMIEEELNVEIDISDVYDLRSFSELALRIEAIAEPQQQKTVISEPHVNSIVYALNSDEQSHQKPRQRLIVGTKPSNVADIPSIDLTTFLSKCSLMYASKAALCEPESVRLTYSELLSSLEAQAFSIRNSFCQRNGIILTPDTIIPVLGQRSSLTIMKCLSVLIAGAAYLPIDIDTPAARIKMLFEESGADCYIGPSLSNAIIIPLELKNNLKIRGQNLRSGNTRGDMAYVIYTSGTTGTPKGACIKHEAVTERLANFCDWCAYLHSICSCEHSLFRHSVLLIEVYVGVKKIL